MSMTRKINGGDVAAVLVAVLVLMNCVNAQVYQCWGGCYNQCFLRSNQSRPERVGCYFQCLNGCLPRSASDFRNYCQIGCSLELCRLIPINDGARTEKCLGRCSNLCNP